MTARAAAVLLALALLPATSFAATIYLKDGRKLEGEIVERTDKAIKVKLANGKVETVKPSEVKSIDEPPPPPPKVVSNETGDAPVDARSKEYERWLQTPLAVVLGEFVVVRGDHPPEELKQIAESADKTARHFCTTFGIQPVDALRDGRYGAGRVEIFQFWKEGGYVGFCDKVVARIRDELVDDARLALMRRQRGLWIMTPRTLMAQYQGPSDITTSIAQACHKTSHVMLTGWKPSGTFMPWWLYEGLATWQSFAILGDTRTYCLEVARPADYSRGATPDADEEAKSRSEDGWRARVKQMVARRDEKDLARLGKMSLNELTLPEVQQSWSVVDWLHQTARLKDFVTAYKDTRDLDAACRQVLAVPTAGAHDAWRSWVSRVY